MAMISRLPWWAKLCAKLLLARLPVPYSLWRKLKLFRHGEMNDPARAIRTFENYYRHACEHADIQAGFTVLELGPGDSILSGLVARSMGASRAWLVDAGAFADTDVAACHRTLDLLKQIGYADLSLGDAASVDEVLRRANVTYLTRGTASLADIPDASIDFFWSQVVLEHVPYGEFLEFLRQLRRIVKSHGIGVHSVDFRDHLSNALNNLRFSHVTWESQAFRNSGFYTNRIRPGAMLSLFKDAGFDVEVITETHWPEIPTPRAAMVAPFRELPAAELSLAEYEVLLWPR
ncbi:MULTISPECIES: methyltransferase domain-containing protein [unclassified Haematospirillum]|nr:MULTISPECIES: methyltransferase domain-containing protein [unclassified Haematospirillum]NKD56047.1 methyltransferase domain-containing protein [Haematospirillum sp. H4890]NKD76050.1 methyltransferase domain-containing protein [Haematospirillum sp. H4485]NKD88720.1 methyltransferase domain-containing protein [Haematospirillum sp. 15-248]